MGNGQMVSTRAPQRPDEYLTADQFLSMTVPQAVPVRTNLAWTEGSTTSITLPQTGMAARMMLCIQSTIVVAGTVTGGTFQGFPSPAPFSIIKRLRFGSNASVSIRNLSGHSAYSWVRYRYGMDPQSYGNNALYSSNTMAAMGLTSSNRITPSANVAAGTYTFNIMLPIDVCYNQTGERALLNLQSNSVQWLLQLDWGNIAAGISATGGSNDVFNGLTGTGLSVTPTVTASLMYEFFETVQGNTARLESQYMSVQDQVPTQILNNGENIIKPPTTETYTSMLFQLYNNGAALDLIANTSNWAMRYAGNVYQYQTDPLTWLSRSFYQHRQPPQDGMFDLDFGLRRGVIERRDIIDSFNDANIVDLNILFTIPQTLTLTGKQGVNSIYESLLSASN